MWSTRSVPGSITGINAEGTLRNRGVIAAQASASAMTVEAQTVFNDGTIAVTNGAAINLYGNIISDAGLAGEELIAGNGVLSINQGGVGATVAASQTIDFADNTGTLELYFPQQFAGVISGFATGDVIQLPSAYDGVQSADTLTYAANILTLYGNEGGGVEKLATFHLLGSKYTVNSFAVTEDPRFQTSLDITTTAPVLRGRNPDSHASGRCRRRGAADRRSRGDPMAAAVCRSPGSDAAGSIAAATRRRTRCGRCVSGRMHFGRTVRRATCGSPPDHAVFTDGVLIPIKHLINGRSIAQVECHEIEYFHVELARHDILLAEGLPAESYLDTGNRAAFANDGVTQLHPDFAPLSRDDGCAELVQDGPRLVAVKQRLFTRAGITPARQRSLELRVMAGNRVLSPAIRAPGRWRYAVPPDAKAMHLVSPAWMPAACEAGSLDRRVLGVRVFAIEVDDVAIDLDAACLDGFHPSEATAEGDCRWTTGEARIALTTGTRTITLSVGDGAVPDTRLKAARAL